MLLSAICKKGRTPGSCDRIQNLTWVEHTERRPAISQIRQNAEEIGVPYGNRTRVAAVKGKRPNGTSTRSTDVSHSEFNPSKTDPTHFLQIWILPEKDGLAPEYEQRSFPDRRHGRLRLLASREGLDGSLTIHQDVKVFDALLDEGDEIPYELSEHRHAWIQVITGDVVVNGIPLQASDGAAVSEDISLSLRATKTLRSSCSTFRR
jgi:quercetinase-like protein